MDREQKVKAFLDNIKAQWRISTAVGIFGIVQQRTYAEQWKATGESYISIEECRAWASKQ